MEKLNATTAAEALALFPHILGFEPHDPARPGTRREPVGGHSRRSSQPHRLRPDAHLASAPDVAAAGVLFIVYSNEPAADPNPSAKPHREYVTAGRTSRAAQIQNVGLDRR